MKIKESAENYLEAIYVIKKEKGFVRSVDVANYLNFTKPSVSVAMKTFREEGYILMDPGGGITLTEKGRVIAERIYERHEVIAKALIAMGVSEKTAYDDSCKIEHDLCDESFEKIKAYLKKVKVI